MEFRGFHEQFLAVHVRSRGVGRRRRTTSVDATAVVWPSGSSRAAVASTGSVRGADITPIAGESCGPRRHAADGSDRTRGDAGDDTIRSHRVLRATKPVPPRAGWVRDQGIAGTGRCSRRRLGSTSGEKAI